MTVDVETVREPEQLKWNAIEPDPLIVESLTDDSAAAWDEFVLKNSTGSFFHLTSWMKVIQDTCYIYSRHGGRITGIFPLFRVKNWITGDRLISTPFAVSGGICAEDDQSEDALLHYAQQFARKEALDYLELRSERGKLYSDFHPNCLYATFTKDLSSDAEVNFKRMPSDTRYMIRRATKAGLRAQHGLDQMNIFFRLFSMNMHHHGTPMFPRSLFRNIEKYVKPEKLDVLVIYLGDEPISAVLSFFHKETVFPYYAGLGPKANKLAANNFMYWELMKYAAECGYRRFDFGRSKKGTGAFAFKSQWNMQIEELNYQVYLIRQKEPPDNSPLSPRFQAAIRIWQKLPLWATTLLGPYLVKCFP
jgi:FemAB-related protein (PEP-CTERM system-associated)